MSRGIPASTAFTASFTGFDGLTVSVTLFDGEITGAVIDLVAGEAVTDAVAGAVTETVVVVDVLPVTGAVVDAAVAPDLLLVLVAVTGTRATCVG